MGFNTSPHHTTADVLKPNKKEAKGFFSKFTYFYPKCQVAYKKNYILIPRGHEQLTSRSNNPSIWLPLKFVFRILSNCYAIRNTSRAALRCMFGIGARPRVVPSMKIEDADKKKKSVKIICGYLRCEASAGICVPIFIGIGARPRVVPVFKTRKKPPTIFPFSNPTMLQCYVKSSSHIGMNTLRGG